MKYYSKNGNMVYAATWILRLCNRGGGDPFEFSKKLRWQLWRNATNKKLYEGSKSFESTHWLTCRIRNWEQPHKVYFEWNTLKIKYQILLVAIWMNYFLQEWLQNYNILKKVKLPISSISELYHWKHLYIS